MGLDRARAYAHTLFEQAMAALGRSGLPDTRALAGLAEMVVARHA
jgi:farnesyl diphosphate synthase